MLNPAFVEQNMTPFYQSMEQARQEAMKKQVADAYMNASDDKGKFDQLMSGTMQGYVDPNIINSFQKYYEYNNPYKQPYKFDTGATTQYGTFNPASGEYAQSGEFFYSLSPSQAAEIGLRRDEMNRADARYYYGAGQEQNQFDATMANNNYWKGIEQGNWTDTFNAGREDAAINQGFEERRIGAIEKANDLTSQQNKLKNLETTLKALSEQRDVLYERMNEVSGKGAEQTKAMYQKQISDIEQKMMQIATEMNSPSATLSNDAETSDKYKTSMNTVFNNEGGYVNDPNDKGGATNMGITSATFQEAKKRGFTKTNSVAELSKDEANNIYREMYWKPSKADEMPEDIATPYIDSVVHHGIKGGAKLLQKAINTFAGKSIVSEDGTVGEETINTLNSLLQNKKDRQKFINTMLDIRDAKFDEIAQQDYTQQKFLRGWKNRTSKLREKNTIYWEHPDGDIITKGELEELIKQAGSERQLYRALEKAGYQRAQRKLSPKDDMRPSYMRGNVNLGSVYTPFNGIR